MGYQAGHPWDFDRLAADTSEPTTAAPSSTATPPRLLLHLKSSVTFSGSCEGGLRGAVQHAEGRQWENRDMGGVNPI